MSVVRIIILLQIMKCQNTQRKVSVIIKSFSSKMQNMTFYGPSGTGSPVAPGVIWAFTNVSYMLPLCDDSNVCCMCIDLNRSVASLDPKGGECFAPHLAFACQKRVPQVSEDLSKVLF